jgi:alpha-L-fucosidase
MPATYKTQIVEVIINNVGSQWVLANNSVRVSISSPGYQTVVPGYIKRLRPGDQAKVQVRVVNARGTVRGSTGNAMVLVTRAGVNSSYNFNATFGIVPYDATYGSIYTYESQSWYNGAKYGVFIHWVSPSNLGKLLWP